MPSPVMPSDVSLREMLEVRRLAVRDRRLAQVIAALRARADGVDPPPRSLMSAITSFSADRSEHPPPRARRR